MVSHGWNTTTLRKGALAMRVTSVEFQRNFGTYQDMAQQEPVEITRHGRPALVLMSAREYGSLMTVKKRAFTTAEAEAEILESIQRAEMDQRHAWLDTAAAE
jgi:prevent-host-death family protein